MSRPKFVAVPASEIEHGEGLTFFAEGDTPEAALKGLDLVEVQSLTQSIGLAEASEDVFEVWTTKQPDEYGRLEGWVWELDEKISEHQLSELSLPWVLMSRTKHDGWKLEELLLQMQIEIQLETNMVQQDVSDTAQTVKANNQAIIELLARAEELQRASLWALAKVAKDTGPAGKPRIGNSSCD